MINVTYLFQRIEGKSSNAIGLCKFKSVQGTCFLSDSAIVLFCLISHAENQDRTWVDVLNVSKQTLPITVLIS